MNRLVFAALIALSAMPMGCKKDPSSGKPADPKPADKKPEPPPKPFTGALTADRIMGAKDLVKPFNPWAEANAKLEAQLGKATFTKGDWSTWAVLTGDSCAYLKVQKVADGGGQVGAVQQPMTVAKDGPVMNWDECREGTGMKLEPPEDPNAPAPPADGTPITVAQLRDGVAKAKSKWIGQKVTLHALLVGMTTATDANDPKAAKHVSISLSDTKDISTTAGCELAADATYDEKTMQWTPLTVEGKVDADFGGELAECRVVAEPARADKGKGKK